MSKREQPLGESDSAASPNYEEKSASPNLYNNHHSDIYHQSEIRDKSSPYHRRDLKTGQVGWNYVCVISLPFIDGCLN